MITNREMRVSRQDREDAVAGLRTAYSLGCLDDDELDERSGLAYAAKTRGDLADLVTDLPRVPPADITDRPLAPAWITDWPSYTRRTLAWGCWLLLAAAGAWLMSVAASGITEIALIFAWLAVLRLSRVASERRRR